MIGVPHGEIECADNTPEILRREILPRAQIVIDIDQFPRGTQTNNCSKYCIPAK